MVKTSISVAIEKGLLKDLDGYIKGRADKPSRSSIITDALQKDLKERLIKAGRADIAVSK